MSAPSDASKDAPEKDVKGTPDGLAKLERWLPTMLVVAGFTLAVVVLAIFLTDGKWLIEESSTSGDGATKTVTTKKYSDTLPIAAVSAGVLLVFAGAFFGRIIEISGPGGWTVKLAAKVEHLMAAKASDPRLQFENIEQLTRTAQNEALGRAVRTDMAPRGEVLDQIAEAAVTSTVSEAAKRYDEIRAEMEPGGERDKKEDEQLESAEREARAGKPSPEDLARWFAGGDRIRVLGAMRADPDLRDPDLILRAIRKPHDPFDHDRFMVLAGQELHRFDDDQRGALRKTIELQRASGKIKPHHVRWATSERVLRLMRRYEAS